MLKSNSNSEWMDLDMSDLDLGMEFGGLFSENEILNLPQVEQEESGPAQLKEDEAVLKKDLLGSIVDQMELDKVEEKPFASFFIDPSTSNQVFLPTSVPQTVNFVQPAPSVSPSPSMTSSVALSPCPSNEDTQSLIEEMEEFLVQQEQETNQEGAEEAEKLLEALIKGEITMDDDQINNVTQMQTLDDGNIVIVIANDDSSQQQSPAQSEIGVASSESDSDWTPDSPDSPAPKKRGRGRPPQDQGRVTKRRGPYNTKSRKGQYDIKDKKERKKLQNVVAARRYRDKKKSEMSQVECIEAELDEKNRKLKEELAEMEGEVKTLKKLLIELGLVTVQ